jgi:HEAT repeat protein
VDDLLPWSLRQDAARALGEFPPPAGTAALAEIARRSPEFELIEEATLALAKRGQMQAVPGCLRLIDGLITDYLGRTESDEQNLETIAEYRVAKALDLLGAAAVETILDPTVFRGRGGRDQEYLRRPNEARIVALLRIGPTAIAPVTAALSSSSPQTAANAARVAARVARHLAVPALVDALGHTSAEVREGAVASLRYLRGEPLRPLLAGLLRDPSEDVREEAGRAVVGLAAGETVPLLVDLLSERSGRTRALAVDALSKLGAPELRPRIPELIADRDERVVKLAVAAAGSLRAREAVPALLSLASGRGDYQEWSDAIEALGNIGDPSAVQLLDELLGDVVRSYRAALALAEIGPAGEQALLEAADSGDAARSRAAVGGLLRVDTNAALDRILAATADPDWLRLGEWVGLTAPIRLELLNDPRGHVRAAAARGCGDRDDPAVAARLRELAESDPDARARAWALFSLPGDDPAAVALRLARLGDPEPVIRETSAASLGNYNPPGALEALRAQLQRETEPEVKSKLAQDVSRLEQHQLWAQRSGDADLE